MDKKKIFSFITFFLFLLTNNTLCHTHSAFAKNNDSKVHWLNWIDYKGADTVEDFEKKYSIKVFYNVFDSNEVLESKLLSGQSGFDLVPPSQGYFANLYKKNIFSKLNHDELPNIKYIDKRITDKINESVESTDALDYGIPYLWGTTGIGYNKDLIEKTLGKKAPVNSWALVFDIENIKALHKYGVGMIDAPDEIFHSLFAYLGIKEPKMADYQYAFKKLLEIRPYINYFNSSRVVNELANGDICLAIGWSGDMRVAKSRAAKNIKIEYSIPKEGAVMWVDMLAIPGSSKNKSEAHCLINYLLDPKIIASITNETNYANANTYASKYIYPEIADNIEISYTDELIARLFIIKPADKKIKQFIARQWSRLKSNN